MKADREIANARDGALTSAKDLELVREIVAGSLEAWHEFLLRYTGLIHGVLRRQLFMETEDEIRNVYADVIRSLYERELAKYCGEASLATWLIVHARSRSIDFLRKRYGRRRMPKWYEELSAIDRDVLRFFIAERLPLGIVIDLLGRPDRPVSASDVAESCERIRRRVDIRNLRWIEDEDRARADGIASPQMLRCVFQLQLDSEAALIREQPDSILAAAEEMDAAERIRDAVANLDAEERHVVLLRFSEGLTAKEISDELRLGGERRAYTVISRILRKLRRMLVMEMNE